MKTKQANPMPAFVGTAEKPCHFDCEFSGDVYFRNSAISTLTDIVSESMNIGPLYGASTTFGDWDRCRPRLNNPQVLPDWGWLENTLLEGFVWEARYSNYKACSTSAFTNRPILSSDLVRMIKDDNYIIEWVSCIGVQQGSQLEEWAKANDVPIYNDDMEVVK